MAMALMWLDLGSSGMLVVQQEAVNMPYLVSFQGLGGSCRGGNGLGQSRMKELTRQWSKKPTNAKGGFDIEIEENMRSASASNIIFLLYDYKELQYR
jgi:hypothetical protein